MTQQTNAAPKRGRCGPRACAAQLLDQAVEELAVEEAATLIHMREEEELAGDVYLALHKTWGLRIFADIAASEQKHTDALASLLTRHGIADPVVDDTPGVLVDEELGELYEALVVSGRESLANALIVGATVEDLDIADLVIAIAETDKPDLRQVHTNLLRGSENHLRAFVAWLAQKDQTYTPQFISQARFDGIVGTQPSRGR
jgi:hypothetical protein